MKEEEEAEDGEDAAAAAAAAAAAEVAKGEPAPEEREETLTPEERTPLLPLLAPDWEGESGVREEVELEMLASTCVTEVAGEVVVERSVRERGKLRCRR